MNVATTLAASVQAKKGRLYAVIQVRENGRTKPVWRALGLPESANKSKVNKAYREVVQAFEQSYAEQIALENCVVDSRNRIEAGSVFRGTPDHVEIVSGKGK